MLLVPQPDVPLGLAIVGAFPGELVLAQVGD
jgi:hypothetical protein